MVLKRHRIIHQGAQIGQVQMLCQGTRDTIGAQLVDDDEQNVSITGHGSAPFATLAQIALKSDRPKETFEGMTPEVTKHVWTWRNSLACSVYFVEIRARVRRFVRRIADHPVKRRAVASAVLGPAQYGMTLYDAHDTQD